MPGFEGELITPEHPAYDAARTVWNGGIDHRPRAIARCGSTTDVVAAVRFGREQGLPITARGGGHGVAGAAVCDDGLVIDLGPMKRVEVDPAAATATVQGGVRWGELDAATHAFGLATTGGIVSHTGVAGLTLGGGLGWLMRRHGLAVDNLLAAEVVTADGDVRTATERACPDLFWGLRGGGPGLGVVTSFTYRLHPVGPLVLAGHVAWALEDAPDVLRAYREYVATAPREVATIVTLRRAPPAPYLPVELHRRPVCLVGMLALAAPDDAERLLAPMRGHGRPLIDLVKHRPYPNLQSLIDATVPHGWHYHWKATGLRTLSDEAIDAMVEHSARARSPWSFAVMFHLQGAVADADPATTAYSRRGIAHEVNVNAAWLPDEPLDETEPAWARGFIEALGGQRSGVYLNFLDRDDGHRAAAAFSATAGRRLADLRHELDPAGALQVPQPAVAPVGI